MILPIMRIIGKITLCVGVCMHAVCVCALLFMCVHVCVHVCVPAVHAYVCI